MARATGLLKPRPVRIALVGLAVVILVVVLARLWLGGGQVVGDVPTAIVGRGPLTISVTVSGTVQSREQVVLKSEVEGSTSILWVVPEGKRIAAGDLLVELDASSLTEKKNQQQIVVLNSEASFIRARENLAVTKSQNASDVAKAELAYEFAKLDLTKYIEGEYPRQLQKAQADIAIAKEELNRAEDKLEWSKKLASEGYIRRTELQADQLAAQRAQINLELAENDLKVLTEYTHQRDLTQLKSDVDQAAQALERTRRKVSADLIQAEAELKAKQSEHERQQAKLDKIKDQIAKCRITAPVDGMVVYATTGKFRWRGNVEPLAEGQQVRERQELIRLPTTSAMMAKVKVHESSLRKIRTGLPVLVTVDALPGERFWAKVGKIAPIPDAYSAFINPDLTVYETEIHIDDTNGGKLREGMTCQVEIIVAEYDDAVFVPIQAIGRHGAQTVVYVRSSNRFKPATVTVGLDNNRMAHILSGLEAGQVVSLAPPLAVSGVSVAANGSAKPSDRPEDKTAPADANAPVSPEASKLRDMSPEQRRKYMESLTPAQREQLRKQRPSGSKRHSRGGGGQDQ